MGRRACQGFLSYVTPRRVLPCAALGQSSPCSVRAVPTLWGAWPPALQLAQEDHTPGVIVHAGHGLRAPTSN